VWYETSKQRKKRWAREQRMHETELEMIGTMLGGDARYQYRSHRPEFLSRDDHDGYLVTRQEVGLDPYDLNWPRPRSRRLLEVWPANAQPRGRKDKRPLTARDRVARVKPSLRIVPTGKRSAELIITRRLHELSFGLAEALNLARMIEGAVKYRDPVNPNRKTSWRQQLRSVLLYRSGALTFLVRNPLSSMDSGKWTIDREAPEWSARLGPSVLSSCFSRPAVGLEPTSERSGRLKAELKAQAWSPAVLDLGPFAPEGLRNGRSRPFLSELYPQSRLPKQYLDLIDRQWLTEDGQLFAATPGGDFATTLEGYRLRLPLAVMPPAAYERWLARGGSHRRRRKRRKGLRAPRGRAGACRCAITTPNLSTLTTAAKAKQPFFRRN
jgi:hypothetical protein